MRRSMLGRLWCCCAEGADSWVSEEDVPLLNELLQELLRVIAEGRLLLTRSSRITVARYKMGWMSTGG